MAKYFTKDHEWLDRDGDVVTVGITNHAQSQLGDIVFLELPKIGRTVKKGDSAAIVESVKAASDVYAPLSGAVVEVNEELELRFKQIVVTYSKRLGDHDVPMPPFIYRGPKDPKPGGGLGLPF